MSAHPLVKALKEKLDEIERIPEPTATKICGVVVEGGGYRMIVTRLDQQAVIPPV